MDRCVCLLYAKSLFIVMLVVLVMSRCLLSCMSSKDTPEFSRKSELTKKVRRIRPQNKQTNYMEVVGRRDPLRLSLALWSIYSNKLNRFTHFKETCYLARTSSAVRVLELHTVSAGYCLSYESSSFRTIPTFGKLFQSTCTWPLISATVRVEHSCDTICWASTKAMRWWMPLTTREFKGKTKHYKKKRNNTRSE